ncbi:MAG: Prephenate dehydratase, partial [Planctomycetota bacterium]
MSQVPEMKLQRLEEIDRELARLVAARISLLGEMSADGQGAPTSILQEQQRLERLNFHDGISSEVRKVLSFVVGATHLYGAKPSRVAYLGPEHSYSYLAACKFFGGSSHLQAVSSIGAVFEEVERGQSRYGVVPIENSTDGRIVDT